MEPLNYPKLQNWISDATDPIEDRKPLQKNGHLQENLNFYRNSLCRKISIFDLPNEIVLEIFSYLDKYALTNRAGLVCKVWNSLSQDASLWKSLTFDGIKDMSPILRVIEGCSLLQHLVIQGSNIDCSILNAIANVPSLQSLSLCFCHLSERETSFKELIKSLVHLNSLNLEGSEVSSDILNVVSECTNLRYINLSHCTHLQSSSLIQILENCKNLQGLDLDGINFLEEFSVKAIFKMCSTTIVSLYLDGDYLSDNAFTSIQQCSQLARLSISFCDNLTDVTLHYVSQIPSLRFLKLRKGVAFTASGIEKMFRQGTLSQLTNLSLAECSLLDNSSLAVIAENCHELVSLKLNWCWEITDEGLFVVIKNCPKLIDIDLTGLVRLVGIWLPELKTDLLRELKTINLEQCGCIEDNLLIDLVEARPTLRIFSFWGDLINPRN